jgi:protein-tyrosine phosphatase
MNYVSQGKKILKRVAKNIYWNVYGCTIRNPAFPKKARSILFICKGNICRSPFAERLVAKYLNDSQRYNISSAGIYVDEPKSPPPEAISSALTFGINLHDHKSRPIRYSLMEEHDIIIAMEAWQYKYLRELFIEFEQKIFLFPLLPHDGREHSKGYLKYNIQDPYGKYINEFEECFNRIDSCAKSLIGNIRSNPIDLQ